jgi:hypothetical protein
VIQLVMIGFVIVVLLIAVDDVSIVRSSAGSGEGVHLRRARGAGTTWVHRPASFL